MHTGRGRLTVAVVALSAIASAASAAADNSGATDPIPLMPAPTAAPAPTASAVATAPARPPVPAATSCLLSGDGYFRAQVGGALDAKIDWPNRGTQCQGESKTTSPGIRMSFQRAAGGKPNWLFVFGLTGVTEGAPAHNSGVNLTIILQGTSRIFGTLGDSRCTVDSLTQKPLTSPHAYRVEARGFCTQPAHAVRGDGDLLVSTFEFAGLVNYAE